jgi:hypothetical protein
MSEKGYYSNILTKNKISEINNSILVNTPIEDKLHVIAVMFNPTLLPFNKDSNFTREYEIKYKLFKEFVERIENNEPNVILYIAEMAYGDKEFIVTDNNNSRHLQLRTEIPLWHRENLVNLAIKNLLPDNWKAVAWIDTDIEFENVNWAMDTLKVLNGTRNLLNLYSHCNLLINDFPNQNNEFIRNIFTSFGYNHENKLKHFPSHHYDKLLNWIPGFAIACTRELYESLPILSDFPQFGYSSYIFFNCINDTTYEQLSINFIKYKDYLENLRNKILNSNIKLGYIPGVINQYFHGRLEHRNSNNIIGQLPDWEFVVNVLKYNDQGILIPDYDYYNTQHFLDYLNEHFSQRNCEDIIIYDNNINELNIKPYIKGQMTFDDQARWGPTLWIFLHTLAQNIKVPITVELLYIIQKIFLNIDCQHCIDDSLNYFTTYPLNKDTINTKEELQLYFLNFHNYINKKFEKPIFLFKNLEDKYKNIKFMAIYSELLKPFFFINNIISEIKTYFDTNIDNFN